MRELRFWILIVLVASLAAVDAAADGPHVRAQLEGVEEVPAISTTGAGTFAGTFSDDGEELDFELSYAGLTGNVTQAHIHFGQRGVNGGISIFLCTNLGNGPPGIPACPASPATVAGTRSAADVIGPAGQGIAAMEWEEVKAAIRAGAAYVNVHSNLFPGGEIRGQLRVDQRRNRP